VSGKERDEIQDEVSAGRIKLLYIAPERLKSKAFSSFLESERPSMLVVDEAHCISQYGHDFRPAFLRIGETMKLLPGIQIVAFTATATPFVREDVRRHLLRPDMELMAFEFARPNLAFSAVKCSTHEEKLLKLSKIVSDKKPTIIYVTGKDTAERIGKRFNCPHYHADVGEVTKQETASAFINGQSDLIVATCAFGMGVDRPDVRRVVHFNVPSSLEAYYQEAGRAGRDNKPAECVLLHSAQDYMIQKRMLDDMNPSKEFMELFYSELWKIAHRSGTRELKLTNDQLMAELPWNISDSKLGTSLNILDTNGYIMRKSPNQLPGTLMFLKDLRVVEEAVKARHSDIQLKFVQGCIASFGKMLMDGVSCSYDCLSLRSELTVDQVKKVIHKLRGSLLAWTPPSYRRSITLTHTKEGDLSGIAWHKLRNKKDAAVNRLNAMFGYIDSSECRQKVIMDYFGDKEPYHGHCLCDNCNRISR
jgi:ATP-dependent DNA helicase RecQ